MLWLGLNQVPYELKDHFLPTCTESRRESGDFDGRPSGSARDEIIGASGLCAAAGKVGKERGDVSLEEDRRVPELRRGYSVRSFFVFLNLLERDAEGAAKIALVIPERETPFTNFAAHVAIYRMWTSLGSASHSVTVPFP